MLKIRRLQRSCVCECECGTVCTSSTQIRGELSFSRAFRGAAWKSKNYPGTTKNVLPGVTATQMLLTFHHPAQHTTQGSTGATHGIHISKPAQHAYVCTTVSRRLPQCAHSRGHTWNPEVPPAQSPRALGGNAHTSCAWSHPTIHWSHATPTPTNAYNPAHTFPILHTHVLHTVNTTHTRTPRNPTPAELRAWSWSGQTYPGPALAGTSCPWIPPTRTPLPVPRSTSRLQAGNGARSGAERRTRTPPSLAFGGEPANQAAAGVGPPSQPSVSRLPRASQP